MIFALVESLNDNVSRREYVNKNNNRKNGLIIRCKNSMVRCQKNVISIGIFSFFERDRTRLGPPNTFQYNFSHIKFMHLSLMCRNTKHLNSRQIPVLQTDYKEKVTMSQRWRINKHLITFSFTHLSTLVCMNALSFFSEGRVEVNNVITQLENCLQLIMPDPESFTLHGLMSPQYTPNYHPFRYFLHVKWAHVGLELRILELRLQKKKKKKYNSPSDQPAGIGVCDFPTKLYWGNNCQDDIISKSFE